jgi:hypothetical protein
LFVFRGIVSGSCSSGVFDILVCASVIVYLDSELVFVLAFDVWCYILLLLLYIILIIHTYTYLYYTLPFFFMFSYSQLPHSHSSCPRFILYVSVFIVRYLYLLDVYLSPGFWPRMFYRSGWLRCVGFISIGLGSRYLGFDNCGVVFMLGDVSCWFDCLSVCELDFMFGAFEGCAGLCLTLGVYYYYYILYIRIHILYSSFPSSIFC